MFMLIWGCKWVKLDVHSMDSLPCVTICEGGTESHLHFVVSDSNRKASSGHRTGHVVLCYS